MIENINKRKLKEVISQNQFGICPICGKPLGLLQSRYDYFKLWANGKYASKHLGADQSFTIVCECGYKKEMIKTIDGLVPKSYYKNKDYNKNEKIIDNPIGKVEE